MSDRVEVRRVTVIEELEPNGDVSVAIRCEPNDMALIEIIGLLAFAQHSIAIERMEAGPAPEERGG